MRHYITLAVIFMAAVILAAMAYTGMAAMDPINSHQRVWLWDGEDQGEFDESGALLTIDVAHSRIHRGELFTVADSGTNIQAATPKLWRITSPNTTQRIHLAALVSCDGGYTFTLYEDPTLNAAGSALTPRNHDRNSATTATAAVFEDTTVQAPNDQGTALFLQVAGADNPAVDIGGQTRTEEWILKQNEDYIFEIDVAGNGTNCNIDLNFYEVTP